MSGRPRLLFLCQTLPFPPDGGVWIRTFHVLRLLAGAFDVTALCFERAAAGGPEGWSEATGLRGLGRFASVEVFPVPQRHSRSRFAWDHLRSVALGRVYTRYLYRSRAFGRRLAELLRANAFDLVHVDSLDLAGHLPACRDVPVACVHHDVESSLLRRRGARERSAWRRAYLRHQAALMEKEERRWCPRVALNVAVSERDAASLQRIAPGARVAVVPNGVSLEEFEPDGTPGTGVAFVGGTSPSPNRDALRFFSEEIAPHLRGDGAPVPVRWIGRASAEEQRHYRERHGVELTGYVEDVRPSLRAAACHVVPLRIGGGTRLKILGSWAMGKPVVSTSVGCEGLRAADGENILIRDDPRDFAEAVRAVLADDGLRRRLGANGRATAERFYGWEAIGRQMVDTYLRLPSLAARAGSPIPLDGETCGGHA